MKKEVKLLSKDVVYNGYFQMRKYRYQHTLFNGGWSKPLEREVFERGRVVAVLPYDRNLDAVLLVEQCRTGALDSEFSPWLMEVIAGIIDEGETPEGVVRREAMEEAGCGVDEMTKIATFFVTPGGSTELAHLYFAECDLSGVGGVHGLAEEGEDIATHIIPRTEAMAMLERGEFVSTKVIIALQWLALHHQRLIAGVGSTQ